MFKLFSGVRRLYSGALPVPVHRGWLDIRIALALLAVILIPLLGFFQECPGLLRGHLLFVVGLGRFLVVLRLLLRLRLRLFVLRWLFLFWLILLFLILLLLILLLLILLLIVLLLVLLLLVLVLVFRQELFNFPQEITGLALVGQGSDEIGGFYLPEGLALQGQRLLGKSKNIRACFRRYFLFCFRRIGGTSRVGGTSRARH